jgi:plastocyanin
VAGKVVLMGKGGAEPDASGTVVWLPGVFRKGGAAAKAQMASRGKAFEPHVIAVPEGTTVEFPNYDKIHHNAFSVSEQCKFDLGLYKNGDSRPNKFGAAGVCRVYCNIHAKMSGIVLVTKGDASTVTGKDGSFRIDGVPPGKHVLKVWHEKGGQEAEESVEVAAGQAVTRDLRLDVSGFKEKPHLNKHGEPYGKDDEARY